MGSLQQFVSGLKSRTEESRNKAARDLQVHIITVDVMCTEIYVRFSCSKPDSLNIQPTVTHFNTFFFTS